MQSLLESKGCQTINASIVDTWEFQPDVLLMFTSTSREPNVSTEKEVNNTFLWDQQLGTIRETKFTFGPKYQDLQVDLIGTENLSLFQTFYFSEGKGILSPSFYIENHRE